MLCPGRRPMACLEPVPCLHCRSPREPESDCFPSKQDSVGNPQEWHLPSGPGGPKPVSSLCHPQQPPSQSELDQDPPQMSRSSCSWEAEGLHCSCSSRAWPAPSVRWRLGEGLLEGNSSNVSFSVSSSSLGPW
ncbi:hypothetical protein A6R68_14987, partial [Neotoma lepida]